MKNYFFTNDTYGDTEILEENGKIHLRQLFGLEMEVKCFQPARATGLQDVFTSLGNTSFCQKIQRINADEDTIKIVLDLYDGKMEYCINLYNEPELGMIRRKDVLRNLTDETIQLLKVKQRFTFADDRYSVYIQKSEWGTENYGQWSPLTAAGVTLGCISGRTCESHTPMLGIRNPQGRGVMVHLIPKGNWEMNMRLQSRQNQGQEFQYILETGDTSSHFNYPLKAGEIYEAPELWLMSLSKGLLGMQTNLQRYFIKTDTGRFRISPHPLVYNTWLDRRDAVDLEHMKKTVVNAKELGVEIFVVDAGWFGNCVHDPNFHSEAWYQQVGDWTEKRDGAFYGKLGEFADFVRSQGLGFGLWIEPERIGKLTPIVQAHPEYFTPGYNFLFPKMWLPEVREYMFNTIDELITRYQLVWIKNDFNHELQEDPSGCELHTYYDNWYAMMEELKEKHPECVFEGCASGGLRNDIRDMLSNDASFLSDNANDVDAERFFEQSALRLPAYKCQRWFAMHPGARYFNNKTLSYTDTVSIPWHGDGFCEYTVSRSLDFISTIFISSNFAISGNYMDLTPEQKETVKKYIGIWKQYRDFYRRSILLLGSEPGVICQHQGQQHLQYLEEESGNGLVFIYKFDSPREEYLLRLRELELDGKYHLTDVVTGEAMGTYSGRDLMYRGLRIPFESWAFQARMIDCQKIQ